MYLPTLLLTFYFPYLITSNSILPFFLILNNTTSTNIEENSLKISPCVDFYQYVCKPWELNNIKPSNEPVWSPWVAASHEINRKLTKILKNHSVEDEELKQAQVFYKNCVNPQNFDHLNELNTLIGGLGGWPLVNSSWDQENFDWIKQITTVTRLVAIYPILKFKVDIDYNNPKQYMLYIEPGDLIFPGYILGQPQKYPVELKAYERWIHETVKIMNFGENVENNELLNEIRNLIKFEMHLSNLIESKRQKTLRLTIGKLSKKIPVDNWLEPIKIFLQDFHEITNNTTITIRNYSYLKNLLFFIKKTPKNIIANYLMWSVVKDLSRDSSQIMRNLNFQVNRAVFGIKKDFSREYECVSKVIEHFSPVLVKSYVVDIFEPYEKINKMVDGIKSELVKTVKKQELISDVAIKLIVEKVESIKVFLGYPTWYKDDELMERYRIVHMTDNHFVNVFLLKTFKVAEELRKYGGGVKHVQWPSSPFDVNAFYSILQNAIFIPLGLMQPPFFDATATDSLNYGALGALIGHELTHSIDPMGILADKTGKVTQWLPQNDRNLLKNLTKCYQENPESVGERIADETGVEISLKALKHQPRGNFQEFFKSFAGMWCEIGPEMGDLFGDEHAPVSDRVRRTLQSNGAFHEVFGCPSKESESYCKVW